MNEETILICCIDRDVEKMLDGVFSIKHDELWVIGDLQNTWGYYSNEGRVRQGNSLVRLLKSDQIGKHTRYIRFDIHNFEEMLYMLNRFRNNARGYNMVIYAGAGTPEFGAAATVLGMMFDEVEVATTNTVWDCELESADPLDEMEEGPSQGNGEVKKIEYYKMPRPDLKRLRCLAIYETTEYKTEENVVKNLIEDGIWFELPRSEKDQDYHDVSTKHSRRDPEYGKLRTKERNFYTRQIVKKWHEYGWVRPSEERYNRFEITDLGKRMIRIFEREPDNRHKAKILIKTVKVKPDPLNGIDGEFEFKCIDDIRTWKF